MCEEIKFAVGQTHTYEGEFAGGQTRSNLQPEILELLDGIG